MTEPAYPFADIALARRLERAEGAANRAFVDARSRVEPDVGAAREEIAGVDVLFDGVDSPLTQTFGLGLFDSIGGAELERMETFFARRGAPTAHEVCPLASTEVLGLLCARGYRAIEVSNVMVRPTRIPTARRDDAIEVRRVDDDDGRESWCRVASEGWSAESPEIGNFIDRLGRLITHADGVHSFLALLDGRPVAAGSMAVHGDVALLAGATTIPSARRRGAQRALLDARLRFAAANGIEHAMMVALPGSSSQRNAERQAFRIVYTRTKWLRVLHADVDERALEDEITA